MGQTVPDSPIPASAPLSWAHVPLPSVYLSGATRQLLTDTTEMRCDSLPLTWDTLFLPSLLTGQVKRKIPPTCFNRGLTRKQTPTESNSSDYFLSASKDGP